MQKNMDKYFWDGDSQLSEEYKLRRILEYASFPDLISYPVKDLREHLPGIHIDDLRTSGKRKQFIKLIMPFLSESDNWDDVINKLISRKHDL